MNTQPSAPPTQAAVVTETHVEVLGHRFCGYPTISELADILGHTYRTMEYPTGSNNWMCVNWIWDELGIAACSWTTNADKIAKNRFGVRCVYFALRSLGRDEAPLKPFPMDLTVFGHRWAPGDDPHHYIKRLLDKCGHVGFHPTHSVVRWQGVNHETERLQGGGTVVVFDPTADPSVSVDSPNEVAVRFNFPSHAQQSTPPPNMKVAVDRFAHDTGERGAIPGWMLLQTRSSLHEGEVPMFLTRKHWSAFLPWILSFIPSWVIALALGFSPWFGVLLCLGIAMVQYFSYEYVVTDRRVLLNRGILSRAIDDKDLRSIKDVSLLIHWVDSFLGRGTVTLAGTGGEAITLKHLADPEGFRNAIRETQHKQT